jgi:hypothetical protein
MSAEKTLPDFPVTAKTLCGHVVRTVAPGLSDQMLRSLADCLEAAINAPVAVISRSQRIVELAGAQWVGVQKSDVGPWIIFRDPVCHSTCMVLERGLSIPGVLAKLESKRAEFGVVLS